MGSNRSMRQADHPDFRSRYSFHDNKEMPVATTRSSVQRSKTVINTRDDLQDDVSVGESLASFAVDESTVDSRRNNAVVNQCYPLPTVKTVEFVGVIGQPEEIG